MFAELAPELAAVRLQKRFAVFRCEPDEITHMVIVSCTGFQSPGLDLALLAV